MSRPAGSSSVRTGRCGPRTQQGQDEEWQIAERSGRTSGSYTVRPVKADSTPAAKPMMAASINRTRCFLSVSAMDSLQRIRCRSSIRGSAGQAAGHTPTAASLHFLSRGADRRSDRYKSTRTQAGLKRRTLSTPAGSNCGLPGGFAALHLLGRTHRQTVSFPAADMMAASHASPSLQKLAIRPLHGDCGASLRLESPWPPRGLAAGFLQFRCCWCP